MLKLITPTELEDEPISVTQLAFNLRLITDETVEYSGPEKSQLQRHIQAAREDAENYTDCQFSKKTLRKILSAFAESIFLHRDFISGISVSYYDSENAKKSLSEGDVFVTAGGVLEFAKGFVFPDTYRRSDAVQVDFIVGFGVFPNPVIQAILLIASHWYENRESSSLLQVRDVPYSFQWLLDSYRRHSV